MKFIQIQAMADGSEGADLIALTDEGEVWIWEWPQPIKAYKDTVSQRVHRIVGYTTGRWIPWAESEQARCHKCTPSLEELQKLRDEGYVW